MIQESQYVRVVKEADSKSAGFSRAGSNPAADVFAQIQIPSNIILILIAFRSFINILVSPILLYFIFV
jgi:hypothetical protein